MGTNLHSLLYFDHTFFELFRFEIVFHCSPGWPSSQYIAVGDLEIDMILLC